MDKKWIINDDALFSFIGIRERENVIFKKLIEEICNYAYDKQIKLDGRFEIKKWLEDLLERELFLSVTKKRHRDHLLHACRIALLGERILMGKITYDGNKEFRLIDLVRELLKSKGDTQRLLELYEHDTEDGEAFNEKILQVWYIAALFHDVGFIYGAFTEVWQNLAFLMNLPNFKEMYLDVEKGLTDFKNKFSVSVVRGELYKSEFTREFDHSKIGACLISNLLGESNLVCDMAAFITDHHSSNETLDFTERPLSFLMVLLDELQEWNRPVLGRKIRDQILSEKIRDLSPFIEYPKIAPELKSVSLCSDKEDDFEIIMENKNLSLDFTLDYGDNAEVLKKTDFSFPLMLYLKYKDLQRLRIGEKAKLEQAFQKVLVEVSSISNINSKDDYVTLLDRESVPGELKERFEKKNITLENPKVWIIHEGREWKIVDDDKKYSIQKEGDYLNIKENKKCTEKAKFSFSISSEFIAKGALARKWRRQCDILLYETLQNKNNVLSEWLDDIIDYRTKDTIKFEIGNMKRILSGDFRKIIERSHEIYLRDENIVEKEFTANYNYKTINNDEIEWITKIKRELKNNNPNIPIDRLTASFDEEIIKYEVKEVKEGDEIITPEVKRLSSFIPKKEYEAGKYEQKFVMFIPLKAFLEDKKIEYEVDFTIPNDTLFKNHFDDIYNIRSSNIERGEINVSWEKGLFDGYFETDYLFFQGEVGKREKILDKMRKAGSDNLRNTVDDFKRDILTEGEILEPHHLRVAGTIYNAKKTVTNIRSHHSAGFIWIPKSAT